MPVLKLNIKTINYKNYEKDYFFLSNFIIPDR